MSAIQRRDLRDGLLFSAPYIIGVVLLWLGPMLYSFYLILQDWTMLSAPKYIGLGNFQRMFADKLVGMSLYNTAYYTFLGVPLQLIVALALALLLNQEVKGLAVFRTLYYLPAITPAVASAVVWAQVFNPQFGILNEVLHVVGVRPIKWLFETAYAKPAFILMSLWSVGPGMIIFLAGLQSVPREVKEAASIDGANNWQRFLHVTVPVISPVLLFNLVMGVIGSFQVFTSSFIMTNGGPQNSTLFMVLYIYRNAFQLFKMGYAALLAWVLFLIIMAITVLQFVVSNRWVYYEGKV
jgi:multiple sugar transport system permease protein